MITDIDVAVSPTQVDSGTTNDIVLTITNGSADRIRWLKFIRPSTNFTLTSISNLGVFVVIASDANSITINGGTINSSVSRQFTLDAVVAADVGADSADWIVQGSDVDEGTNPYTGTGASMGTSINYTGSRLTSMYLNSLK